MGCSFKHDCFKCEGSHRALTSNFAPKPTGFNHRTEVEPNLPLIQPSPAQQLPTPVNIRCMIPFLSGYDHSVVQLLESGFTFGFLLHFDGLVLKRPLTFFQLFKIRRR